MTRCPPKSPDHPMNRSPDSFSHRLPPGHFQEYLFEGRGGAFDPGELDSVANEGRDGSGYRLAPDGGADHRLVFGADVRGAGNSREDRRGLLDRPGEKPRSSGGGTIQQLPNGAGGQCAPAVDDRHAIAHLFHFGEQMARDEDRDASLAGESADEASDFSDPGGV